MTADNDPRTLPGNSLGNTSANAKTCGSLNQKQEPAKTLGNASAGFSDVSQMTPTGLSESPQDTGIRDIYRESVFASVSDIRRSVAVLQENGIGELARWFDGLLPPNDAETINSPCIRDA